MIFHLVSNPVVSYCQITHAIYVTALNFFTVETTREDYSRFLSSWMMACSLNKAIMGDVFREEILPKNCSWNAPR